MAYVELKMWDVLEVLKHIYAGKSVRQTSRITGRARKTVGRYVETAENLGWVKETHPPDEELAGEVISLLKPGPSNAKPGENEAILSVHHDRIRDWLKIEDRRKGLQLTKVLRLLNRQGVDVNYIALYRYAVKHLDFGRRGSTFRLDETEPGEYAQVDFGRMGLLYDPETGKNRTVHALIVTLVQSRHQYVHLCHTQTLKDFILGMEKAFEFFGGIPKLVILDNLKAAVIKANKYNPIFNRTFSEYAKYRGFEIDAADSKSPTQKPHVERQVPYVRNNFFKGEDFLNLDHSQREAIRWCLNIAGMRVHGTTRKQPFVEFQAREQKVLEPLTKERFDTPDWATPIVHPDCHVRFKNALYSVNYKYRGKKTDVRGDSKLVHIYIGGKLVKTHPRLPDGGRSTDHQNDYPSEITPYTMRDANYIIRRARDQGENIGEYAEHLLGGRYPWNKIRESQKLMRLCEKYGETTVDAACARALSFDLINVTRLEKIIKNALEKKKRAVIEGPTECKVVQMPLMFMRDQKSFNHSYDKELENDGTEQQSENRTQAPAIIGTGPESPGPTGLREEDQPFTPGVSRTDPAGRD